MNKMTPPIKDLLPRLTPILKNRYCNKQLERLFSFTLALLKSSPLPRPNNGSPSLFLFLVFIKERRLALVKLYFAFKVTDRDCAAPF